MSTFSRASQLRRFLIVSRLRREIMNASSASSISSSSSTCAINSTSSSDADSLNKLFVLKTHFTELDERRRNAASFRLFGQIDEAVSGATSDGRNNVNHQRRSGSCDRKYLDSFNDGADIEYGLNDKRLDVRAINSNTEETDGVFRQNVSDFAGILEDAMRESETIQMKGVKQRAWTTDDIIQPPVTEVIERERVAIGSIFNDQNIDYYQILDKYVAHSWQEHSHQNGLDFLLEGKNSAEGKSGEPKTILSDVKIDCPYYLSTADEQSSPCDLYASESSQTERKPSDGPRKEDLLEIYDSLRLGIPRLLDQNLDYSLFSPDVVFVNDWYGNATTSVGLKSFVCRMALLRAVCNVLFVRAEMQLLKIMAMEAESCIRARWRIEGTGILTKLSSGSVKGEGGSRQWFDGMASIHVNHHGKIARVEVYRVLPDEEHQTKKKSPVSLAIAALIGGVGSLAPNGAALDFDLIAASPDIGSRDKP